MLQAEPDILVTTGSDRGIALYDLRSGKPQYLLCCIVHAALQP